MINYFQRPLLDGWVYPCSLADIEDRLSRLPSDDLEGIGAVGLVPSTRKDWTANARYFHGRPSVIHICSYADTLTCKMPAHTKLHHLEGWCREELRFGMRIEQTGSRFWCRWAAEDLRRFILEHVLLHEVGHNVYWRQRGQPGPCGEQFAEDYARRMRRTHPTSFARE